MGSELAEALVRKCKSSGELAEAYVNKSDFKFAKCVTVVSICSDLLKCWRKIEIYMISSFFGNSG